MLETNSHEWEEYDSRVMSEGPFMHDTHVADPPAETYASPFVAAREEIGQESEVANKCQCVRCRPVEMTTPEGEGESLEADPYAPVRSAMSPEHANLSTEEVTLLLGSAPARVVLHRLLNSPAAQQVALASLLGHGARQSVRLDGADISVPGFLRVISRLSGEVAEEYDVPKSGSKPIPPKGPRGIQKYSDVESRVAFYTCFKAAIQGVAGWPKLNAGQKATLAEAMADIGVVLLRSHREQIDCATSAVGDTESKDQLPRALNLTGPWGDAFTGALQTTSGDTSRSPQQAVQGAADIADQAVLASGHLDDRLWNIFMNCKRR